MLFIVAVALAVVIQSCVRKDGVWYNFVNNSADEVEFLFPIKPMSYYPFICGDMFDIDIDDTTVTSARPLFARCTVFHMMNLNYIVIILLWKRCPRMIPLESLSITEMIPRRFWRLMNIIIVMI